MKIRTLYLLALIICPLTALTQNVDIKLHDAKKGIISMKNNLADKNLGDCHITWTLLENGHPVEVAQINNLKAEPGATAYLEFPYSHKPFVYGGERWIRIEIKDIAGNDKKNDADALAWNQFMLPETSSPPPRPLAPETMPDIETAENNNAIKLSNDMFSVSFNKKSGLINSLRYYKYEIFTAGPTLALEPATDLTNIELVTIKDQSGPAKNSSTVVTEIRYKDKDGNPILKHTADYTIFGDGTIIVDNTVEILSEELKKNIKWVGLKSALPRISHIDWYGRQQDKPIQIYKTDPARFKESDNGKTGRISDIRWLGLTDKFCRGVIWCNMGEHLSSTISIMKDNKTECLLGIEVNDGHRADGLIKFSTRMHRYDTVLMFPDKLWYVEVPPKKAADKRPHKEQTPGS